MSSLTEVERAADALAPDEQRQLLLHLAERLRSQSIPPPAPREYTREQIQAWLARDVAELREFESSR